MLYFVETGLTNYLNYLSKGRLTTSDRPCRTDVKPTGKMTAFNLTDFAFAFFLFGIGVGLSLFTFILELIISAAIRCAAARKAKKSWSVNKIILREVKANLSMFTFFFNS